MRFKFDFEGTKILILSDRGVNEEMAPIPALLACAYLNRGLFALGKRSKMSFIIESAEPREVHHFALLFGYGASAINPYLVNEILQEQVEEGNLGDIAFAEAIIENKWVLLGLTALSCYLLNAEIPLFALKFKNWAFAKNKTRYLFLILAVALLILLKFAAIPVIILLYVLLSLFAKK